MKNLLDFTTFFRRYEILLASGGIIIIVVVFSFKLLLPNFAKANNIFLQKADLKAKLGRLEKKYKALSSLDQNYYSASYSKFDYVLPKSKDYVTLFFTFDNLQTKTGVTILGTEFQLGEISTSSATLARSKGDSAYQVPMTVTVLGTPEQLENFMSALTDLSGRILTVDATSWEAQAGGFIQVTVVGNAYFYPPPKMIKSVDAPLPVIDKQGEEILSKVASLQVSSDEQSIETTAVNVGKKNLFE